MNTFLFHDVLQYLLSYLACLIALQNDVVSGKFNLQWTSMHDFEMNRNRSPQVVKMAGLNSDLNLFFVSSRLGNRLGRKDRVVQHVYKVLDFVPKFSRILVYSTC